MGAKIFPRAAAFCVNRITGDVGVIHQYPQEEGGGQEKDGSPVITLNHEVAEVHVLNTDGTTGAQYRNVPIRDLRIAKVSELPAKRRMSEAMARKYGYPLK